MRKLSDITFIQLSISHGFCCENLARSVYDDDSSLGVRMKKLRHGYFGWLGFGGSAFQWHPEAQIGFAYVPTYLAWDDCTNARAGRLQRALITCVEEIKKESFS